MALLLAPAALIPLASTPASALSIVSYTTEASYKAALISGSFSTDNFNDLTTGFKPLGINRTAGSYSYNISAPVGLFVDHPDNPIDLTNKAIQTSQEKTRLLISFAGVSPTAVGGNIFISDDTLLAFPGTINVNINDGAFSQDYTIAGLASNYLGWTSADGAPITSIAFTSTADNTYSAVDNFTPGQAVPGPLPVLGALVAFRYSRKLRKRLAASTLVSDSTSA